MCILHSESIKLSCLLFGFFFKQMLAFPNLIKLITGPHVLSAFKRGEGMACCFKVFNRNL